MSSEDSSTEEEDIQKLKEATWSFGPATNGSQTAHSSGYKGSDKKETQSRRTVASEHENDGNELETTPEFRAHVAKKLGTVLDRCIAEVSVATVDSSSVVSNNYNEGDEDEGFRLFSTSVPGMSEPPPAPSRKRPVPSSSDSDSDKEMRFREAAVTISDIVRPYYTEKTEKKEDLGDKAETNEDPCESLVTEKKKKKKKKKKNEGAEEKASPDVGNGQIQTSTRGTSQPEQIKKKKKKKKKKVDVTQVNEIISH